jgi:hypothetical protein
MVIERYARAVCDFYNPMQQSPPPVVKTIQLKSKLDIAGFVNHKTRHLGCKGVRLAPILAWNVDPGLIGY